MCFYHTLALLHGSLLTALSIWCYKNNFKSNSPLFFLFSFFFLCKIIFFINLSIDVFSHVHTYIHTHPYIHRLFTPKGEKRKYSFVYQVLWFSVVLFFFVLSGVTCYQQHLIKIVFNLFPTFLFVFCCALCLSFIVVVGSLLKYCFDFLGYQTFFGCVLVSKR